MLPRKIFRIRVYSDWTRQRQFDGVKHDTTHVRVYSDWTRQRQFDGVKHKALVLEHMLINRCIQTGRVASGIRGNPKDVDVFVMQEESRRAVSSTTLRLLC